MNWRTPLLLLLLFSLSFVVVHAENPPLHFAEHPSLSPDGKTLYFSLDGAIWSVPITGGTAQRITGMQGEEKLPKVSPDGKWLAFSSNQYGNNDVYLLPLEGGSAKQLTFHEANDEVSSWSWDSKWIYFTSDRQNRVSTYRVNIEGGTPERIFEHYFNTVHDLVPHPKTGELFFNLSWESQRFDTRKGYKGPYNPDIQSYDPTSKTYKQYTDWEGKDFNTTIDRHGNIYFISDEENGQHNLYTFEGDQKTALTSFEEMVHNPTVNADGGTVVFEKDYQLWKYDISEKTAEIIPIEGFRHNNLPQEQSFKLAGNTSDFAVSSDEKKIAYVAKGRLFVSDTEGKFIKEMNTDPGERILEVYWLKNDKELLYNRTVKGFTNWFRIAADGKGKEVQLTATDSNNRLLSMNPKKDQAIYLRGREEVMFMNLNNFKSTVLAKDELWGFQNDRPHLSPDGKYGIFTARRKFETDVMLVRLADQKVFNLTQTGVSESNPSFSLDGKYLYFISDRTEQAYPYGMQHPKLYRIPLARMDKPFRSVKFDSLFVEKKAPKKESKKTKKEEETVQVNIDFSDFMGRIEQVGPRFGDQRDAFATFKGNKEIIYFTSNHEGGKYALYKLEKEPFENEKTTKITSPEVSHLQLVSVKKNHYLLIKGDVHKLEGDSNNATKIETDHFSFTKNLEQEFKQMFDEVWANLDENYYNETFNGVDWRKIRERYAGYLPYIQSRSDLRRLLTDMMGELNTSHYGFTSSGKEEKTFYKTYSAETGIAFENENPFTVKEVIAKSTADFKGKDIQSGDELIAVNGTAIVKNTNREAYFTFPKRPEEIELTFLRNGVSKKVRLHPQTPTKSKENHYEIWISDNAKRVFKDGKKRIGYVHMKDMTGPSLKRFREEMVTDSVNRDGLILDLRYNTGGNVHDKVLQFLSQRPYLQWKYREGKMSPQPDFAPAAKPIIVLINEQTLSDGEMTTAGFKELGLGTVVGMPTYRWIIFTSAKTLVDGSSYRLPSWGVYTLSGEDLEKTGVSPDIEVKNTFIDRLEGKDSQLDKAIELILKDFGE